MMHVGQIGQAPEVRRAEARELKPALEHREQTRQPFGEGGDCALPAWQLSRNTGVVFTPDDRFCFVPDAE